MYYVLFTAKMTNMVCAACILGVGIGIGGIFLYRVLRKWLQQSSENPSLNGTAEQTWNNRSAENIAEAHCLSKNMV